MNVWKDKFGKEYELSDIDDTLFYQELTETNYLKCCDLCRKLFLGEE